MDMSIIIHHAFWLIYSYNYWQYSVHCMSGKIARHASAARGARVEVSSNEDVSRLPKGSGNHFCAR